MMHLCLGVDAARVFVGARNIAQNWNDFKLKLISTKTNKKLKTPKSFFFLFLFTAKNIDTATKWYQGLYKSSGFCFSTTVHRPGLDLDLDLDQTWIQFQQKFQHRNYGSFQKKTLLS